MNQGRVTLSRVGMKVLSQFFECDCCSYYHVVIFEKKKKVAHYQPEFNTKSIDTNLQPENQKQ